MPLRAPLTAHLHDIGPLVYGCMALGGDWNGGPLTEADYRKAAEESGFTGKVIVGTDLATLRLPTR